jgi:hypothetical protein
MMHRLRDSEDENRVLADALAASRKAVTKRELESAKLREEFKSIADANGDNDDAKMELIASLFDKVDSLTTRLASVTTTRRVAKGGWTRLTEARIATGKRRARAREHGKRSHADDVED